MTHAALCLDLEALRSPAGRETAGESFLRGFLKHASGERLWLWNRLDRDPAEIEALLARLGPPTRPVTVLGSADRAGLAEPAALHIPGPALQAEAWARRAVGAASYALTGLAHGLSETRGLDEVAALLIAPAEAWDALVCPSEAHRKAVETLLQEVAEHLQERLGATSVAPVQLVTIPWGVHADDLRPDPAARKRWRERLGLAEGAPAALSLEGDVSHPGPMAMALQGAAQRLGRPLCWIVAAADEAPFRATADLAPDVELCFVDASAEARRGAVWAADVFLWLPDRLDGALDLPVLEAMAAGLPAVVSDWDGLREVVRHGEEGLRIRTVTARPGLGGDLAYGRAHGVAGFADQAGLAAQFAAVDIDDAAEALALLFADADLRRSMGHAALARARDVFDWRCVVPQYQALWAELSRRRLAVAPQPPRLAGDNPWRPDPFRLFAGHPTAALQAEDIILPVDPFVPEAAAARMARAGVRAGEARLPSQAEALEVLQALAAGPCAAGALLAAVPPERRAVVERGLVWLAKYGFLRLRPAPVRT